MNQITEFKTDGRECIAVIVPKESYNFTVHHKSFNDLSFYIYYDETRDVEDYIDLPEGKYEILGEITKDGSGKQMYFDTGIVFKGFSEDPKPILKAVEETGIYFSNPMPPYDSEGKKQLWEHYESKVLPSDKKLIILSKEI